MSYSKALAGGFLFLAIATGATVARAAPIAVTFDPGVVVPTATPFTADKLNLLDYSRVDLGATSGSNTAFSENGYLEVNNVSINNNTFDPAGNRGAYSLYLAYTAAGMQNAPNFNGSSTGTINALTYTLYEAAGPTAFGINGSNQPFATNGGATALANGSLIQGTTSFSTAPLGAAANVSATFAEELAGFILSPANTTLNLDAAFNNDQNIVTVLSGGTSFTLNGGGGDLTFTGTPVPAPEPATLAILGTALVGFGAIRSLRRKTG